MTPLVFDAQDVALHADLYALRERQDPLRNFRFRCQGQRDLVEWAVKGVEVHAHTGNGGGKTHVGAALGVALCRGDKQFGGAALPGLRKGRAWSHAVLVKGRQQSVDSTQAAYVLQVGDWPHDYAYIRRDLEYIQVMRIKPQGWHSDNPSTWSKVGFHVDEAPGVRVDSIHADEPPDRKTWREFRARWREESLRNPAEGLLRWITETPIYKHEWYWLFHEDDGFRGCRGVERDGRISVQWHVGEVHGERGVERLRQMYAGDPLLEARLSGEPVPDDGLSVFDWKALEKWRARCVPGSPIVISLWETSSDDSDRATLAERATVTRWVGPKPWGRYAITVDPSGGFDDGDPNAFQVQEEVDPAVVETYTGRLDPYSLGWLAGLRGREYNNAKINVEMQDGWGAETIRALRRMKYPNIGHRTQMNDPSLSPAEKYGFAATEGAKRGWIGAVQAALAAELQGRPEVKLWSREIVDQLADVVMDKGRVVRGMGHHGEHMTCLGYWLHQLGLPRPLRVEHQAAARSPLAAMLEREGIKRPKSTTRLPQAFRR